MNERPHENARGDEAEIHLQTLIGTASDAILTMDEAGLILTVNPAAESIFGYQSDELVGQPLTMLMPERFRKGHQVGLSRYLHTGKRHIPWTGLDLPGLTKSGAEIPLEISFGEYRVNGRHIFTGIARDVSERRRAQEEREQLLARERQAREEAQAANRAKSQFLATMSHEIRTPINAILGYADLLHSRIGGELTKTQTEYLERLRASSMHLLVLVEDILDLSKVEAGQLTVAHERANAQDAVSEALRVIKPEAEARGLVLIDETRRGHGLPYVGDRDRVRQILLNLLSNATKFTESGTITISCGATDEIGEWKATAEVPRWTWIKVEDTGIGIPAEQLSRIFQPFVQADSSNTRTRGGTGLGLAISRKLAWLMGGDLTVSSEVGVGTSFTLWLPNEESAEETIASGAAGESQGFSVAGQALLGRLDVILQEYVSHLQLDRLVPLGEQTPVPDLQDHAATLLADMAQSLIVIESEATDATLLFRDGSAIQQFVSELHGAQRCRLGWTEPALKRDFDVLRDVVINNVRQVARERGIEGLAPGVDLLQRMLDQAERISLRAWRIANGST